jgi:peroxisomal coenzyme A diphosphatase NUDT7
VLLPLVAVNDEIHVLFEVRSKKLRRQPGEICFPGGRIEQSDKDERQTAIRETTEELGISEKSITDVVPLDYMISFGRIVYPFAGFINNLKEIKPNLDEVEEIFTVPLSYLIEKGPEIHHVEFKIEPGEDFPYSQIAGGENYKWRIRKLEENFYYFEDKAIWGLTAKILKHFISITK